MNEDSGSPRRTEQARCSVRVQSLREIAVSYEGRDEQIVVKPPNLSTRGMFISTSRAFPEGAILKVRFRLLLTNAEVETRCEVRYCLPGVGIGVEFISLVPESLKVIEHEIALGSRLLAGGRTTHRPKKATLRSVAKRPRATKS